jgi:Raf kinase inhibitor-like YbhB/YbcL family protein
MMLRLKTPLGLAALAFILLGGSASARIRANDVKALAIDRVLSPAIQPLYVSSPAFPANGPIPELYTALGKDLSFPVTWDGVPPGTRSFVLIMQDSDAPGAPALHWLAYNIPGDAKGLPRNIRNAGEPKSPLGMLQGINYAGGVGYIGPNPPPGDKPHHYHVQVFALDRPVKVKSKADLEHVLAAMNDRVLAEGEVVGLFAAPAPAPQAAPHAG